MGLLECDEVLEDDNNSKIKIPNDAPRTPWDSVRSLEWCADQGEPTNGLYLDVDEVETAQTVSWTGYISQSATIAEIGKVMGYTESTIAGAENCYNRLLQLLTCTNDEATFKICNKVYSQCKQQQS